MKTFRWICGLVYFALIAQTRALEIAGKVESVSGDTAKVIAEGNLVPNAGDKVDIFFKMAGLDEEIAVANGKVTELGGDGITVKIDEATGTVTKDQLVRIISPKAVARIKPTPAPSVQPVTPELPIARQTRPREMTFGDLPLGNLEPDALATVGIRIEKKKGEPQIFAAQPNMLLPPSCKKVMMVGGDRVTSVDLHFDPPVKRFALQRVGTTSGASTPTWSMTAYNRSGKSVGKTGEEHGLPLTAKKFALEAAEIARVQINSDNRYGTGTWATRNSLPIAAVAFDR